MEWFFVVKGRSSEWMEIVEELWLVCCKLGLLLCGVKLIVLVLGICSG